MSLFCGNKFKEVVFNKTLLLEYLKKQFSYLLQYVAKVKIIFYNFVVIKFRRKL